MTDFQLGMVVGGVIAMIGFILGVMGSLWVIYTGRREY